MSVELMTAVWKIQLPLNQQAVLLAMADHGSDDGSNVFPSNGRLAWKLGVSEDTIRRLRKQLEDSKILVLVSAAPGKVREYRIDTAAGVQKEPYQPKRFTANMDPTPPQIARGLKDQPPRNGNATPPQIERNPPANNTNPPAKLCNPNHVTTKEPPKNHDDELHDAIANYIQAYKEQDADEYPVGGAKKQAMEKAAMANIVTKTCGAERIGEVARKMFQRLHDHGDSSPLCFRSKQGRSIKGFADNFTLIKGEIENGSPRANGVLSSLAEPEVDELGNRRGTFAYQTGFAQ